MLLAIDVGNTNIVIGVMQDGRLLESLRLTTRTPRTSDEYGILITEILALKGVDKSCIKDIIMVSVVPDLMYSLSGAMKKYFHKTPLIVGPGTKTGIALKVDNPREVGAGRIVNSVAAYELYGGPCMVIDFATATTFDVLTEKGEFIAGITVPGIQVAADALCNSAAQLPTIELKCTKHILDAKNTVTSMQTGIIFGYIGQVEYIVKKVKEQLGQPDLKVVATGGLANIIEGKTEAIDTYDYLLALKGLERIYQKNSKDERK